MEARTGVTEPVHTSPQGLARWCRIQQPDCPAKTRLFIRKEEAGPMLSVIDTAMKASLGAARATPGTRSAEPAAPPYRQTPSGFSFVFRGRNPLIVGRDGKPFPVRKRIGDGSVLVIDYQAQPFHALDVGSGVTLWMLRVVVCEFAD